MRQRSWKELWEETASYENVNGASQDAETSQGSSLSSPEMIKLHGKLGSGAALLAVQRGLHRTKEEQRSRAICVRVILLQQLLLGANKCNEAWVRANSATSLPLPWLQI